ncbi:MULTISPECIES: hypothetical protein [Sphingobacterium]|uniref:hypothetical protein n=1 Tax=Sphingobacterium TaxID=28453 RepID=UPI00160359D0|nr:MULTISPECIES: hypothetical protein [Sphingobacterium]
MDNNFPEKPKETGENILRSYSAGDLQHPHWYIYEYGNHRKVLVEINPESGKVHFLREL